uniref:Uncharacterized protein n=1 Tax=Trichogramma kaykai TaxID=54128 RepID=A0ABD2WXE0_9HYME
MHWNDIFTREARTTQIFRVRSISAVVYCEILPRHSASQAIHSSSSNRSCIQHASHERGRTMPTTENLQEVYVLLLLQCTEREEKEREREKVAS